jgi:hypothetical protein
MDKATLRRLAIAAVSAYLEAANGQ